MQTRFAIIIVHRNGKVLIEKCLKALLCVIADSDAVTVVDNGSTDDSLHAIKRCFPSVRIIENGCNNGFAAANNQVLRDVDASYCLLLNSDAFLLEGVLDSFVSLFETYDDIAVITPQLVGSDGVEQRSYGLFMRPTDEVLPKVLRTKRSVPTNTSLVEVDSVIGACMAVRCSAMKKVGVLDDDFFFYFEETEWCYRFKRSGFRVVLDRSTTVIHEKGESTRPFRREAQLEMLRSRFLYYKKVFGSKVALALKVYRTMRLIFNFMFSTILLIMTLGISASFRSKWMSYGYQLTWIILGMPRQWGLPDKCPIGYMVKKTD